MPTRPSGAGATTSSAPVATAALAPFVAFELLRALHTHSIALVVPDALIIVLVLRESFTLRAQR
ncbi:hypothetical protein [Saccharopolyspora sp. SCSIO 74807]|uniref:hypothetical protein n=1 Tax=Saccharopolyspora sp. SCSIO 74807 TaxID=3118084 RepID=UPI0030CC18DC